MIRESKVRPIRVIVADDHAMVREGMAEILSLQGDIEVVGQAGNGKEALTLVEALEPDVVILDVEMPVMGAQATLRALKQRPTGPKVVVVTVFADRPHVQELIWRGASAYISKSASMQDLIATVRAVASGGDDADNVMVAVPRGAIDGEADKSNGDGDHGFKTLSGREMQVLLAVARGMSNQQAAEHLHLAVPTVKRHLSNIYSKLGVRSRSGAVRQAIADGWISARDICSDG